MRIVVLDTNIVFSCLLNSTGSIGDLLFNSDAVFAFYGNEHMRFEIRKHWEKLRKISGLSDSELEISYQKLLTRLNFLNEELIPQKDWEKAELLVSDTDPDDIPFVALTRHLKGTLWTGDKALHSALKSKRFRWIYNTAEMLKLRDKITRQGH